MSSFVPRDALTIQRRMAARLVARTDLTDVNEGSSVLHELGVIAEELGDLEYRAFRVRESFFLDDVQGADLDARVAELPRGPDGRGFEPRRGATYASGSILRVVRASSAGAYTLPAGGIVRRTDDASVGYRLPVDVVFADGASVVDGVAVVCLTPGVQGNAAPGTLQRPQRFPPEIQSVTNLLALDNGLERESDAQLKTRAYGYLASLARCQPVALLYLARSFEDTEGRRIRTAALFEDITRPAYSELLVDDGTGMAGTDRPGGTRSGVVPAGGQRVLWFESPATRPIDRVVVVRGMPPTTVELLASAGDFVSAPERGVLVTAPGCLLPGDTWSVGIQRDGTQYRVWTGFIAELQREVEGDTSHPLVSPGWRAAGTRVRVRPPDVQWLFFDLHVVPADGFLLADVYARAQDDAVSFLQLLEPGAPFLVNHLTKQLLAYEGLANVHVYQAGGSLVKQGDVHPTTPQTALRTKADNIGLVEAPE